MRTLFGGQSPPSLRALRRAVAARRRLLAAGLAAAAVACAITAVEPAKPETTAVLVAARDLPPGATVDRRDVRVAAYAPGTAPAGALVDGAQATGRVLAGGVRAGEPITDIRFVGRSLASALAATGAVATPVRIADTGAVRLLQPGDVVDVLAAIPAGAGQSAADPSEEAAVVADGVRVLTVPPPEDSADSGEGALVLLATSRSVAARLALAAVSARLSITLRGTPGGEA